MFYDHWKDHALQEDIQRLIDIRRRVGLKCNAAVQIQKKEDGCYAAHVGHPAVGVERGACKEIDMSAEPVHEARARGLEPEPGTRGGYQVEGHG